MASSYHIRQNSSGHFKPPLSNRMKVGLGE